jgi:hypothetical protein
MTVTVKLLIYKGPNIPIFNRGKYKAFGNTFTRSLYLWKNFTFLLNDSNMKYMLFYIAVSIIGCIANEIAFSLHLLDIISRFPTLQNVIKAITTNSKQLLLTSFLGLILMYIWAFFGFYFVD